MKGTDTSKPQPTMRRAHRLYVDLTQRARASKSKSSVASIKGQERTVGAYCEHGLQPVSEAQSNNGRLLIPGCGRFGRHDTDRLGIFWIGTDLFDLEPEEGFEVRRVQPYQALKTYVCPGCNRDLPPGLGHMVAVPLDAPDLRRHWHYGCWHARHRRRPRG